MRTAVAAIVTVTGGLFVANMLGVAVAEAPTSAPVRTVSVQGVATLPIGQSDNAAAATAVYRQAMAAAVTDGQGKAAFLASKVGAALGAAQSVAEGGGYISCSGSGESGYAEYEGEQPDFGAASEPRSVSPAAGVAHPPKPRRTRHKRAAARKAGTGTCTLTAQVSLVYALT
jgi:hypothetical protein